MMMTRMRTWVHWCGAAEPAQVVVAAMLAVMLAVMLATLAMQTVGMVMLRPQTVPRQTRVA